MSDEAAPLAVTVCTVLRHAEDLDRFLEALQQQSMPASAFDVVVADATPAGAPAPAPGSHRYEIHLVRVAPGTTPGAALNAAWKAAKRPAVGFLAVDAVPDATWVEYLSRTLHRGRRLVTGRWEPTLDTLSRAGALQFRLWSSARDAPLVSVDQLGCHREDLDSAGGFDEQDDDPYRCALDLAVRLVEAGVDPTFNRWLVCRYDLEPVDLRQMIATRAVGADAVRLLASSPGARGRLLTGGVFPGRAQPAALLALFGLIFMVRDRRAVILVAPWWHQRTCVKPLAAGPRRRRVVLPGVFAFDVLDAALGLKARLSKN